MGVQDRRGRPAVTSDARSAIPPRLTAHRMNGGLDAPIQCIDRAAHLRHYGEAEASPPDRSTFMGFEGAAGFFTSEAYCLGQPWPEGDARTWPVTSGNIQVH